MNFGGVVLLSGLVSDQSRCVVIRPTTHDDGRQRDVDGRVVAPHLLRRPPASAAVDRRHSGTDRLGGRLDADVVRPPRQPAGDRATELLAEAPTHSAVDEEVQRVAEQDDEVDEQVEQVAGAFVDQRLAGGVLNGHNAHADSHRELHK